MVRFFAIFQERLPRDFRRVRSAEVKSNHDVACVGELDGVTDGIQQHLLQAHRVTHDDFGHPDIHVVTDVYLLLR